MKTALIITGIAAGALIVLLLLGVPLQFLGYSFNVDPTALAKQIAERGGTPEECRKLFRVDIGPRWPTAVFRRSCFYDLAQIKKDPTICEFLMPSSYGKSCINDVLPSVEGPDVGINCEYQDDKMKCYSSHDALFKHDRDIVIDLTHCEEIENINFRDWCYIGRVQNILKERDCTKVMLNQDHRDFCTYLLALKQNDVNLCLTITHPIRRSACVVLVKNTEQFPL